VVAAHAAIGLDEKTPISVHGAWEDRTMQALFNWATKIAFSARDHFAALDPATDMADPILIQMRLECLPGMNNQNVSLWLT
jgi:hypothetical protein